MSGAGRQHPQAAVITATTSVSIDGVLFFRVAQPAGAIIIVQTILRRVVPRPRARRHRPDDSTSLVDARIAKAIEAHVEGHQGGV
jgi:hypothetical protein